MKTTSAAQVRGKYMDTWEDVHPYMLISKGKVPRHDCNYPYMDSSDFSP
jgi:sprouty-related EVH1 domain-containing protein